MLKMLKLALAASVLVAGASVAHADGHQKVDAVKFLIPGGAGGGWDGTARGTGEALTKSGLVGNATYENMSGGGGGKARQRRAGQVIVDALQRQHIRIRIGDHGEDGGNLVVLAPRKIAQEQARTIALQFGVIRGHPHCVGLRRPAKQGDQRKDQTVCKSPSALA